MDDILSQIIAYAPDRIDTETKARALVQGPRNMDQEPRNMYNQGQLVQNTNNGSRPGYSGDFTAKQKQKITEAFPDIELNFNKYPMGVKKYLEPGNTNLTNKDYTKILRFKKKGFTTEMGEGKNTRGESYSDEGKRLSIKDQNKIKGQFELPTGEEWDFKTHKYGIKQAGRENLLARMARLLKEKRPWTVAADRGSTKGWMMLQMNRVYENEIKAKKNKLTYEPVFDKFGDRKIIVGFKDNTAAGNGKTYYGLNKYSKKNSTSWLEHGDYKQNQKLVDISKKALKQPNEVIMGLLDDKNFKGNNVKLNHLIHFLSGTEASSSDVLKNAISRHHQSGVAFGSATDDLALTTRTINNKIKGIEGRIANNKILPEDIQTLKNNNVYVRGSDGTLYGSGKKSAIGQFKQIESNVARSLESGVDFKGNKFETKQLLSYLEKLGCKGKAAGGRILFAEGTPGGKITTCATKGVARFMDDLKKGNYSKASLNILKGGGNIIKNIVNPMELLKLRNLIGPGAMGFMAAFEAGVITDDVIRQGTPLNESLANNWLTKSFLPYTKDYAQAKNLLESGTVPSNMKKYVQDVVTFNDALMDIKGIESRKDSRIIDDTGYGMIDGSSVYTKEQEQKDDAALMKKLGTLTEDVYTPGSAKALEMRSLQDENEATRMAKPKSVNILGKNFQYSDGFSPIFGFDKLKDVRTPGYTGYDYIPDEQPVDLRPITYKDAKYEDKKLPLGLEQLYMNKLNLKPRDSLKNYFFKDGPKKKIVYGERKQDFAEKPISILEDLTNDYNKFERQKEASNYPGYYGANEKFMEGGIASLNVKK